MPFDWSRLSAEDAAKVEAIVGRREPDVTISPGGKPYLCRWWVIPRDAVGANVYLHVQLGDDDDRALHDHRYANTSVIIGGQGYREWHQHYAHGRAWDEPSARILKPGAVVHRHAEEAHRLELLGDYSISVFTTGPVVRDWGFWERQGWRKAVSDGEQGMSQ